MDIRAWGHVLAEAGGTSQSVAAARRGLAAAHIPAGCQSCLRLGLPVGAAWLWPFHAGGGDCIVWPMGYGRVMRKEVSHANGQAQLVLGENLAARHVASTRILQHPIEPSDGRRLEGDGP